MDRIIKCTLAIYISALGISLGTLSTSRALADGNLTFSIRQAEGFQRLEVTEKNGVRDGTLFTLSSKSNMRFFQRGERLIFQTGISEESLKIINDEGSSLYSGFLFGNKAATIRIHSRPYQGFKLSGSIDGMNIDITSTPLFKTVRMNWKNYVLEIAADPNPRKSDGSCKGKWSIMTEHGPDTIATLSCQSSGSLKDAFFKSEQDVLIWLVRLLVTPED